MKIASLRAVFLPSTLRGNTQRGGPEASGAGGHRSAFLSRFTGQDSDRAGDAEHNRGGPRGCGHVPVRGREPARAHLLQRRAQRRR